MAGLYPPLSGLPLAVSILTSLTQTTNASPAATMSVISDNGNCILCGCRPRYIDNGKVLDYCGKTCADSAKASTQVVRQPAQMCPVCGMKPRFHDGKKLHDYCGRNCATMSANKQSPRIPKHSGGQAQVCDIPGCNALAYQDQNGFMSKHCSNSHKQLAKEACLQCRKRPTRIGQFCGKACVDNAENAAPKVLEVPKDHVTFKSVADQFKSTWKSAKACPAVQKIYKIVLTKALMTKYEAYKTSVEASGNFKATGRTAGNENRRWHGTVRMCTLGDPGNMQLCTQPMCALCCIVKTSFDKAKLKCGSFGAGIYSSATSSKSDGYSRNSGPSKCKAMLLNKVVVGKGAKNGYSAALTAPPAGYHSVIVNNPGADELVVFTNDAIRPAYLLIYDA